MEDILIIGAGPVGSYIARQLAQQGHQVTVLERRNQLGQPVCCAGIISHDCARLLGADNLPVVKNLKSARVYSPSGQLVKMGRNEIQALTVNRGELDLVMAEQAQAAGARYLLGHKVIAIENRPQSINVSTNGTWHQSFSARLVIVASGFNLSLLKKLSLEASHDFAIGVQAVAETAQLEELAVFVGPRYSPGFFGWLQPLDEQKALLGLLSRKRSAAHFSNLAGLLQQKGLISRVYKPLYRGVNLKPLPKTYGNRFVVVGDAAGQVKPLTAGGLYYGLRAARHAIDTVNAAFLSKDFSARLLAGYQRQWQAELMGDIRLSRLGRKIFEKFNNQQIEGIFNSIIKGGLAEKFAMDQSLTFDSHGRVVLKTLKEPAFYRALSGLLFSGFKI